MQQANPFVSIILPIRNEVHYIYACLQSVFAQDYAGKMQVLVADGMSDDGTRQTVLRLSQKYPAFDVQLLDNPGKIVPTGINIALRQAKGDVVVRVDGHTIIAPDYVRQCVEVLFRSGAENVGGKMNAAGETAFGQVVALATSTPFGVGGARFHYSDTEEWVDTVYMGAWPREIFRKIGLFDEELVRDQDDEFNYRLRASGGKILLSPLIRSRYTVRSKPQALWRQYFQYGYWKVRVLQKHPRQMSLRQFVPPAFVFALCLGSIFSFFPFQPVIRLLLLAPLFSYAAANLGASLSTAARHGWAYFPQLSLAFAILHLGYGAGFLLGLFKFWNRWNDKTGKTPSFAE